MFSQYASMPVRQHSERGRAVLAEYRYVGTPQRRYVSIEAGQCWLHIDTSVRQYASTSALAGQCWLDIDTPVRHANGMSAPERGRQVTELRRTMPVMAPERGRVVLADIDTPVRQRRAVSTRMAGSNVAEYRYVASTVRQRSIRAWQAS
jgi:hypothetical protein